MSNGVITVDDLAVMLSGLSGNTTGVPIQNQAVTVASVTDDGISITGSSSLTYQWYRDGSAITGATNSSYTPQLV